MQVLGDPAKREHVFVATDDGTPLVHVKAFFDFARNASLADRIIAVIENVYGDASPNPPADNPEQGTQ